MKIAKSFNPALFLAALVMLLVLAAAPVFAEQGSDDTVTSTQQDDDNNADDDASKSTDDDSDDEAEVEHKASAFRRDGMELLEQRREGRKHKSKEERAKTCENIQKAVNNKLKAFNNRADKHLNRLNALFNKVQTYQTANNLPVSNYDALLATAIQKQSDATLAVQALDSLGTTMDCSSSDPAAMLTSAKTGAADARNALKDYRAALKAIVVALVQANKTETTTEDN